MKILQVSINNFNSEDESEQRYSPLHFGYHELKDMGYEIDLLYPRPAISWWEKLLYKIFGNRISGAILQMRCVKNSKHYDLIYYPIDRHCILLAFLRKIKLIRCPIVMLCHFSLNTKYVDSNIKKIYKSMERFFVFRYFDQIVFPCERLRDIAMEKAPKAARFGIAHWGADYDWYSKYRKLPSKCKFYMGCGGTNRDYETLIKAVNHTSIPVRIFTNKAQIDSLKTLNPSDNIEFIEAKGNNRKEILRIGYSNAKAVLVPINKINDVPNGATVLVEALASGKPIIISELATNYIDVNQEKVGFNAKLHDPTSWKEILLTLEESSELLDLYAENALSLAKSKFNIYRFAKEMAAYFEATKKRD